MGRGRVIGTYLVDVRFRASSASDDLLHEVRHLGHDVDAVEAGLQRAFQHGLDRLAILGVAAPLELHSLGLGPLVLGVLLDLGVSGAVG